MTSGTSSGTTSGSGTASGTSTSASSAPQPNQPPVAELAADTTSGTVPLNVTFSLGGSDPDGDALDWTLDADGDGTAEENGTGLPATFKFTYTAAGNFTANFTVTDGKASASKTAVVSVAEAVCVPGEDAAVALPTGHYIASDAPGTPDSLWIYEESNGLPGLQRDDSVVSGTETCGAGPDTIVF